MKPTRRGFFSKLGMGAVITAISGGKKAKEPTKLPVFIRADGMLVDGEGQELGFVLLTRKRNPSIYADIEATRYRPGNHYGSPLTSEVVDGGIISAGGQNFVLIPNAPEQLKPYEWTKPQEYDPDEGWRFIPPERT